MRDEEIQKDVIGIKAGMKGRFQSFIEFAFFVLLETRKSLPYVQLNKITIASLKVFLEGF